MELKAGYKQTEVGVIPVDWDVHQIGDLRPFVTSGSRGWADFYAEHGELFVRITNLSRESIYLDFNDCKYVKLTGENSEGTRTKLQECDVLISITADIGIIGYVDDRVPLPAYINQHIALVRFDPSVANGKFLSYFLASEGPQRVFQSTTDTGAKAGMSLGGVQKILTALPPLLEQIAIATAISGMDELLAALDELIVKKRDLKQAAMQQLLSGKNRLPGFGGKWKELRLGDVASFYKGKGLSKSDLSDLGALPCIHYGELFTKYGEVIDAIHSRTNKKFDSFFSVYNDVLMPTSDVTPRGLAKASCIRLDGTILGGDILIIRSERDQIDGAFLSYVIRKEECQILQLVTGTTVFHLYAADMKKFRFRAPGLEEQAEIVRVLSDMNAEIAMLEMRREKARLLKLGMMKELLTGRTRLPVSAVKNMEAGSNVVQLKTRKTKVEGKSVKPEEKASGRPANVHFKRSVLAAEIVDQLHNEPTFGHVKFEKLVFLVEHLCKVDTGSHYHRDAAGPYDGNALRSIDSQLKTQKWFEAKKLDGRYKYIPLEKRGGHKRYFDDYYADISPRLSEIISTFRSATTEKCEIVATLFSAWDDLIRQGNPVSDQAIVDQVLNHWHDAKKRIDAERWHKALSWMREKGFVPEGAEAK